MISTEQKLKLKELLGKKYSAKVLDILEAKKIYNRVGKPYSACYVNHVLNGRNENFDIEAALFEVFKERKIFNINLAIARNQIL